MSEKTIKCVVVGDGAVGKTCLLIRYAKGEFPLGYVPTVFDNYAVSIPVAGENYDFHLFDTAGQEEYDQLRKLTFEDTDIFIVCFSVVLWSSFVNIREKWVPELQEYCPGVPFILVGTKADLRFDQGTLEKLIAQGRNPVTKQQGEKLAKELNAVKYIECSALTKENVYDVFQEAIFQAVSGLTVPVSTIVNFPPTSLSSTNHENTNFHKSNNNKGFNCSVCLKNTLPSFCTSVKCPIKCNNCTIM